MDPVETTSMGSVLFSFIIITLPIGALMLARKIVQSRR
jgi:hypothetical protein